MPINPSLVTGFGMPWLLDNSKWHQVCYQNIQAIIDINTPTTNLKISRLIGMINYYHNMRARISDVLAPLILTEEQYKSFETLKQKICKETLLSYSYFSHPFDLHTDASHSQIGAVLSRNNKTNF
jgi:RNase H-like domain found in reverse transcriptase